MKIGVIGLGYVGLPIAIEACKAGYEVLGVDINQLRISEISNLKNLPSNFAYSSSYSDLRTCEIIVISVPTPINSRGEIDLSDLESVCASLAEVISKDTLVINESTSFIGCLRNLICPLVSKFESQLCFAVSPERIDPGNLIWNVQNTPRVLGALDDISLIRAKRFYESFCSQVHLASSAEAAEASKLLENSYRLLNIAFMQEFEQELRAAGYEFAQEVTDLASTKPYGFSRFTPGVGAGGHCIPVDPIYLMESSSSSESFSILRKAISINKARPIQIAKEIEDRINLTGPTNPAIHILGLAYKPNVADTRESAALKIYNILLSTFEKVTFHDPFLESVGDATRAELIVDADFLVLLVKHQEYVNLDWSNLRGKLLDYSVFIPSPEK